MDWKAQKVLGGLCESRAYQGRRIDTIEVWVWYRSFFHRCCFSLTRNFWNTRWFELALLSHSPGRRVSTTSASARLLRFFASFAASAPFPSTQYLDYALAVEEVTSAKKDSESQKHSLLPGCYRY